MQGATPLLNTMTLPPGATATQPRLVFDGVRGAIFLYQAGGPVGALIGSWAISAGTDPYGNAYPQGFNVSIGSFSTSTVVINNAGEFRYSPSLGAGNLVYSNTNGTGTDAYGNNYVGGVTVYSGTTALSMTPNGHLSYYTGNHANPGTTWSASNAIIITSTGIQLVNLVVSSNGLFYYSATPAAGNLIYSSVPNMFSGGSDSFGNDYLPGETLYNNVLTTPLAINISNGGIYFYYSTTPNPGATWLTGFNITTDPVSTPRGATMQIDNTPNDLFLSNVTNLGGNSINVSSTGVLTTSPSNDAGIYQAGHAIVKSSNVTINSATPAAYLTINVGVGKYHINQTIYYHGNQAAGTPFYLMTFTATAADAQENVRFVTFGSPSVVNEGMGVVTYTGPTLLNGVNQMFQADIWFEFSAAGTLSFEASCTAGDSFLIARAFTRIEQYE